MTESPKPSLWRRDIVGWSLYDFANTIYSMNIVSLYLKRYLVEDLNRPDYYYDLPFAASMLLAALTLPALGALSDHSTRKKTFLFLFTLNCCLAVGLLAVVPSWAIALTVVLFIAANFCYEAGQPFYNALLYSVADGREARLVSGVGVALGYVGSILGMIMVLPFVTGSLFSLDIPLLSAGGKTASFVPTAVLFFLFALPLFLWVRERPVVRVSPARIGAAYREIWTALRSTQRYPGVLRFLVADYFVEDAVATVILNMGIYCSVVLQLAETEITTFLVISTISAVVGSFAAGLLARWWSLKKMLYVIVAGWVVTLLFFAATADRAVVWVLGSVLGAHLGALWTTTRPMLGELVPREDLGKFFGLFALSGRAAAVVGPVMWTAIVYFMQPERPLGRAAIEWLGVPEADQNKLPYRAAIVSLVVMMAVGLAIFRKVPPDRRTRHET